MFTVFKTLLRGVLLIPSPVAVAPASFRVYMWSDCDISNCLSLCRVENAVPVPRWLLPLCSVIRLFLFMCVHLLAVVVVVCSTLLICRKVFCLRHIITPYDPARCVPGLWCSPRGRGNPCTPFIVLICFSDTIKRGRDTRPLNACGLVIKTIS